MALQRKKKSSDGNLKGSPSGKQRKRKEQQRKRSVPWYESAQWSKVEMEDFGFVGGGGVMELEEADWEGPVFGMEELASTAVELEEHASGKRKRSSGDSKDADAASPEEDKETEPLTKKQKKKLKQMERMKEKRKERKQKEKDLKQQAKQESKAPELVEPDEDGFEVPAKTHDIPSDAQPAKAPGTEKASSKGYRQISAETSEVEEAELAAMDMNAWSDFGLHDLVEKGLRALKFSQPTPVQRECLHAAIRDRQDVIGAAETGSGKTLAFGLPILNRLCEERDEHENEVVNEHVIDRADAEQKKGDVSSNAGLRALIIAPTRELALQVCDMLREAARFTKLQVVPIVGGIAMPKQLRMLKSRPEIIVATPGRLWELMKQGESHLTELHKLRFLVLDEGDRMVEQGHFQDLKSILEYLPSLSSSSRRRNKKHMEDLDDIEAFEKEEEDEDDADEYLTNKTRTQLMVFSATLTIPASLRKRLGLRNPTPRKGMQNVGTVDNLMAMMPFQKKPKVVDLSGKGSGVVAAKLEECRVECVTEDKELFLYYILKEHPVGLTVVFCTAISMLQRIAAMLKLLKMNVMPLHANMQQRQRLKLLDRFRSSKDGILVASDVAARGIDVPGIRTVIHFQLPLSAEIYVHRSGRTARADQDGLSIVIVGAAEQRKFFGLCRSLDKDPQAMPEFPVERTKLKPLASNVKLALRIDKLERQQTTKKKKEDWLVRMAREMDIDEEEAIEATRGKTGRKTEEQEAHERRKQEQEIKLLKQDLTTRLAVPNSGRRMTSYIAQGQIDSVASQLRVDEKGNLKNVEQTYEAIEALRNSRKHEELK